MNEQKKKEEWNLVQKSQPLVKTLWDTPLSLVSLKIIDVYLSQINIKNPDDRYKVFDKGWIENLLGVERIRSDELKKKLIPLMQPIALEDLENPNNFKLISLFEEADCRYLKDENGEGYQISLKCSEAAISYVFNVENIGYLKYKLSSVVNLKSRYSYILFQYVENNRHRRVWRERVDTLREYLQCDGIKTYEDFRYFNRSVLSKCHDEVVEKTPCKFSYKPIKNGRDVVWIEFEVEPRKDKLLLDVDFSEVEPEKTAEESCNEEFRGIERAFYDNNGKSILTKSEIKALVELTQTFPKEKLPDGTTLSARLYFYLKQKYTQMLAYDSRSSIENKFTYLKTMIENDMKE